MKEPLLLKSYLKSLKLPAMLAQYAEVARQCTEADASYEEFLERLAERELAARQAKATERRLRQAGFPAAKDLAEFDFAAVPKLNKKRVLDLARGEFIEQRANVVLAGAPGVGKSHVAIALGREACRRGFRVKFFTAAGLVNTYLEAREQRHRPAERRLRGSSPRPTVPGRCAIAGSGRDHASRQGIRRLPG